MSINRSSKLAEQTFDNPLTRTHVADFLSLRELAPLSQLRKSTSQVIKYRLMQHKNEILDKVKSELKESYLSLDSLEGKYITQIVIDIQSENERINIDTETTRLLEEKNTPVTTNKLGSLIVLMLGGTVTTLGVLLILLASDQDSPANKIPPLSVGSLLGAGGTSLCVWTARKMCQARIASADIMKKINLFSHISSLSEQKENKKISIKVENLPAEDTENNNDRGYRLLNSDI